MKRALTVAVLPMFATSGSTELITSCVMQFAILIDKSIEAEDIPKHQGFKELRTALESASGMCSLTRLAQFLIIE